MVLESLVLESNGHLHAPVVPDYEQLDKEGLTRANCRPSWSRTLAELNSSWPPTSGWRESPDLPYRVLKNAEAQRISDTFTKHAAARKAEQVTPTIRHGGPPGSPILSFGNPFYNEASQLFRPRVCFSLPHSCAGSFFAHERTHIPQTTPAVTLSAGAQAPAFETSRPCRTFAVVVRMIPEGPIVGIPRLRLRLRSNDRFAVTLSGATAKSKGLDIAEPHRRGAHGFPPGRPSGFSTMPSASARNDSNPQRQNTPEVETSRNSRRAEAHAQKQRATFVTLCFVENTRVELVTSCMPCEAL